MESGTAWFVVNHIKTLPVKRKKSKIKKNEKPKEPKYCVGNVNKMLVKNVRIVNSVFVPRAGK